MSTKIAANQGGPDSSGYRWIDSLPPAPSVNYDWIDGITGGTKLYLASNDITDWIDLGFNFNYYGTNYSKILICSNGWICFVNNTYAGHTGDIPSTDLPDGVIAAYWKNLHPSEGGGIYYYRSDYTYPLKFIITWAGVPITGTKDYQTFQIVLNELNEIWFQYYSITFAPNPVKDRPKVGIENSIGDVGLNYPTDLQSNMSIRFWKQLYPRLIITEIQDSGAGGERIEVFNAGSAPANIQNYRLSVTKGVSYLTGGTWSASSIPPGGSSYYTTTGGQLNDESGLISLYNTSVTKLVDEVGYGWNGSAPDPLAGESISRYYENGNYTIDWTRSQTPTFGSINNVPKVNHNPEVILSEVLFNLGNRTSYIELTYLGSENSYDVSGYKIICDSVFTVPSCTLSSERDKYILKASQFPSGFDLSPQSDNVYLYS
ncbi:MAG: lamin tail domain-containing protein, partial [Thermoplasmata archaeon]